MGIRTNNRTVGNKAQVLKSFTPLNKTVDLLIKENFSNVFKNIVNTTFLNKDEYAKEVEHISQSIERNYAQEIKTSVENFSNNLENYKNLLNSNKDYSSLENELKVYCENILENDNELDYFLKNNLNNLLDMNDYDNLLTILNMPSEFKNNNSSVDALLNSILDRSEKSLSFLEKISEGFEFLDNSAGYKDDSGKRFVNIDIFLEKLAFKNLNNLISANPKHQKEFIDALSGISSF